VRDIQTRDDLQLIMEKFYDKLTADPLVKHFFEGLNLEHHLPVITDFWNFVILQVEGYKGNPFQKHVNLPNLKEEHFQAWLKHFKETVDEYFEGANATEMKNRAELIAWTFKSKLVK
jgi:hemoglobin